jgi:hypothetical protein
MSATTTKTAPSQARTDTSPTKGTFHIEQAGEPVQIEMVAVVMYGTKKDGITPYEFSKMMRVISKSGTTIECVDPQDIQVLTAGD